MGPVLLTWNPGPFDDEQFTPDEWNQKMVLPHLRGGIVAADWSVGRHVNNIEPGDVAFLYRQGEFGRGIVSRGVIRSYPWESSHFLEDAKTCNFVDVEWCESVPVSLAIGVEHLERMAPDFGWRKVYGSGRVLPLSTANTIAAAWDRHVHSPYIQACSALYASEEWRAYVAAEEEPEFA